MNSEMNLIEIQNLRQLKLFLFIPKYGSNQARYITKSQNVDYQSKRDSLSKLNKVIL